MRHNQIVDFFPGIFFPLLPRSNFLRLGREGYREVMANAMENARYLRKMLLATGKVGVYLMREGRKKHLTTG